MAHKIDFVCVLKNGIHARPATSLEMVARQYASNISVVNRRNGRQANAKSVLSLVGADFKLNDPGVISVSGQDEAEAFRVLRQFIEQSFPYSDVELSPPEVVEPDVSRVPPMLARAGAALRIGAPLIAGIARGKIVLLEESVIPDEWLDPSRADPEGDKEKLGDAIGRTVRTLEDKGARTRAAEERSIIVSHLAIARDQDLKDRILEGVAKGQSLAQAILNASDYFQEILDRSTNSVLRERVVDLKDVCSLLLEEICGPAVHQQVQLREPSICVAEQLTPAQFLALDRDHLKGLVLHQAAQTSHTVILARSAGIPTVASLKDDPPIIRAGIDAILDAGVGVLVCEINPMVEHYYQREQQKVQAVAERRRCHQRQPGRTYDGRRVSILANIASVREAAEAMQRGAEGIGLFRTEMLFMHQDRPPGEAEQFEIYRQVAQLASPDPVTIRLLDGGGDKALTCLDLPQEENPFLGYRGVRLYRQFQSLIDDQMSAIVRASAFGKIKLLVPMVSHPGEIRWVLDRIKEIRRRLDREGIAYDRTMPVGIMIEVPSVVFIIDQLAELVDFFSIGTNDLVQYVMAVDRSNTRVKGHYSPYYPAVIRLLGQVLEEARRHRKPVSICGDLASSPQNIPLLVGLNTTEISVSSGDIPALKETLSRFDSVSCQDLVKQATQAADPQEVRSMIQQTPVAFTFPLLDETCIQLDVEVHSKEEAVKCLVDQLYLQDRTLDPQQLEQDIWQREFIHSTGLGHGIAFPHCRSQVIRSNSIGVLRLPQPIDWQALDGRPVDLAILLAIEDSDMDSSHMRIFSSLARSIMHKPFREKLRGAATAEQIIDYIQGALET